VSTPPLAPERAPGTSARPREEAATGPAAHPPAYRAEQPQALGTTRTTSTLWRYIRYQFRDQRKAALFWAVGLTIYCGAIVFIYPQVKDAIDITLVPENLREAFNINDFTQLASFLSSELFGVILPLLLPFFGMITLSGIVAGAEERGRLDLLLGNPIPRWNLVIGSYVVVATYLLGLVTLIGLVIWGVATGLDLELTLRQSMRAGYALWPVTLVFSALALMLSTVVRQRAVALGAPAAVVFLMFLTNVIGRLAPPISGIRYISVFHYYGNAVVEGLWWTGVAVLLLAMAVLVTMAVVMFNRRDIYA
jgi:ABC-2 type transport system permease protein